MTHDNTCETLRLLTSQREQFVINRTRTVNRIKARLREIDPELARQPLRTQRHFQDLIDHPPGGGHHVTVIVMDATNWVTLNTQIKQLDHHIKDALPPQGQALTAMDGIGVIGAATILAHTRNITRFATDGHFAMMCGTAPLDASSGRQQRHRLNPYGNRTINRVIHTAIITQIAHKKEAFHYVNKRVLDGKTKRAAIRSAKRKLARRIYRTLNREHQLT